MDFDRSKRYITAILITILYATLIFSIVDLFVQQPRYIDYCNISYPQPMLTNCTNVEPSNNLINECASKGGTIEPIYNESGCIESYRCNTCSASYNSAIEQYSLKRFIISTAIGVFSVVLFLSLRPKKKIVNAIYLGFMFGGLIGVLVGTIGYFRYMNDIIRILTISLEIGLVIWIALKSSK